MNENLNENKAVKVENLNFQIVLLNLHLPKGSMEVESEIKISINRGTL